MLNPRWRKLLRDLWGNKARTILVVLSIAIGVSAVGMIGTSQLVLGDSMSKSWNAINPAHASLSVSNADLSVVDKVRAVPGVKEAVGSRRFSVRVKVGEDNWKNLFFTALPDYGQIAINKITPLKGAWPPPSQKVLLERATLEWLGVKTGDTIHLETAAGKQRDMEVAGTIYDLSMMPVKLSGQGAGYVSMDTLEWLGEPVKVNDINITVAEDALNEDHIRDVATKVSETIRQNGGTVRSFEVPKPGEHPVGSMISSLMSTLGVLGLVTLILSGFLVVNVISAMLAQQIRQVGVMKAVGARGSQIVGLYMGYVLIFGLVALVIGIPLGAFGAQAFCGFMGGLLNLDTGFALPWQVLLIEIAVGLLIPMIAALLPILKGTRITTRLALNGETGNGANGEGVVDRIIRKVPLSRPLQVSLRNTFRRKGRLALTLGTLILGGAVFMAVLSTRASVQRTLDNALEYFNYDFHGFMGEPLDAKKAEEMALKVPGVTKAEGWGWYNAYQVKDGKLQRDFVQFVTPQVDTTLINPTVLEGRWLKSDDGNKVVINTDFVKQAGGVKLNDEITLKVLGQDIKLQVVGIVTGQLSGGVVFADPAFAGPALNQSGLTSFLVVETDKHDADSQRKTGLNLEEQFRQNGLRIGSTETTTVMKTRARSNFDILVIFFLVMATVLAIVGGLGLAGTMSINVLERTREIGVMRAIGASTLSILNIFLVEGLLIGVISWGVGALLAMPIGKALSDFIGNQFVGAPLDYVYSTQGVIIWLVASLILAALSSIGPARRASKMSVREVLAYE